MYSTSPIRCRFGQVSLFCRASVCLACLNSQNFFSFALPMKAVDQTPAESRVLDRFGRFGRLYFLVCPPAHLHESVRLSVLPTAPLCPMPSNLSLFFFCCPPLPPSFRVIWWKQTLFLGRPQSPLSRSDPPIISSTPICDNSPRETVSAWRRSLSVCFFSYNLPPISNRQPFSFVPYSVSWPFLAFVLMLFLPPTDGL